MSELAAYIVGMLVGGLVTARAYARHEAIARAEREARVLRYGSRRG